jgi:hypothetical protein
MVPFDQPPVTLPEELALTDAALLALPELERGSSPAPPRRKRICSTVVWSHSSDDERIIQTEAFADSDVGSYRNNQLLVVFLQIKKY